MSTETNTRPQVIEPPKTVRVATIIPWLIVIVMTVALAGLVTGWMLRSHQVVTRAEVRAEVLEQVSLKD